MSNSHRSGPRPARAGDVLPSHVLRDEHGFNASNRPTIVVDADQVPEQLRRLIPYVERWAIPCDVTRLDYFEQHREDVAQFYYAVLPYERQISAWLDAQPESVLDWPAAAVHFMYLIKAHDDAYQPTPEELAEREARFAVMSASIERKRCLEAADVAFGAGEYSRVVALLSPYAAELSGSTAAKLRLALKKA